MLIVFSIPPMGFYYLEYPLMPMLCKLSFSFILFWICSTMLHVEISSTIRMFPAIFIIIYCSWVSGKLCHWISQLRGSQTNSLSILFTSPTAHMKNITGFSMFKPCLYWSCWATLYVFVSIQDFIILH